MIAIIAILAAMLLPALQSAKDKAVQARCTSSRKQVGLAFTMYSSDWDRFMPPSKCNTAQHGLCDCTGYPTRQSLLYVDDRVQLHSLAYHCERKGAYLSNRDLLDCPARSYEASPFNSAYWRKSLAGAAYVVPGSTFCSSCTYAYRIDREITWWAGFGNHWRAWVACFIDNVPDPNVSPHRNRGVNVLYFDGSVKFLVRPNTPVGWGGYSWAPLVEVGNQSEGVEFWKIANNAWDTH